MDFASLIAAMEYRTLTARNAEILKAAYAVQDENISLLKSANAALEENATFLRQRIEQLTGDLAALEQQCLALRRSLPPEAPCSPSSTAWEILELFRQRGVSHLNDKRDVSHITNSRDVIEAAFEELCVAKLVEPSSLGDQGCWFALTGHGQALLTSRSDRRRSAGPARALAAPVDAREPLAHESAPAAI